VSAPRKRIAIVQSCYIPWKGYFDLIRHVDEFILFDDVQFTKRDWRSRNRIKTGHGGMWLTVPVSTKGKYYQAIKDTEVSDPGWFHDHWRTIESHYAKAPFFRAYKAELEDLYRGCTDSHLSQINRRLTEGLCRMLGITTKLSWSMDYTVVDGKTERLVSLCRQAGATEYLSGPAARDYIDPALFAAENVALRFFDYTGYPEYPQLYPPFDHYVSAIDLIVHTGPDAHRYLLPSDICEYDR
jgi:hypothetical protein